MKYRLKKRLGKHEAGTVFETARDATTMFTRGPGGANNVLPVDLGRDPNWFEPVEEDRFKAALLAGKTVWFENPNGQMWKTICMYTDRAHCYIAGEDIPEPPSPEKLREWNKELTGECRVPKTGEEWAARRNEGCYSCAPDKRFSGRRWILREAPEPAAFKNWCAFQAFDGCHRIVLTRADARELFDLGRKEAKCNS